MSAADEAARLREQADALDAEAKLEDQLAKAKDAYRGTDDPKLKARLHKVRDELAAARQSRRGDSLTVGGDAVASDSGSEN